MTMQDPEMLLIDGETYELEDHPPLPDTHERIVCHGEGAPSSSCWRGYWGTWTIRDDKLYLTRLSGDYELKGDEPLFASWVSGRFIAPSPNFASIDVKNGAVVKCHRSAGSLYR